MRLLCRDAAGKGDRPQPGGVRILRSAVGWRRGGHGSVIPTAEQAFRAIWEQGGYQPNVLVMHPRTHWYLGRVMLLIEATVFLRRRGRARPADRRRAKAAVA